MALDKYILLIDQGGHSTRALLYNSKAGVVARSREPVSTHYPQPGFVEQPVAEVLASVEQVIASITEKARQLGIETIESAALICQRSSFVACRKSTFAPLTPVISWMDTRHAAWFEQHPDSRETLQQITGLYPNAHYGASKMRWLQLNDPAVQAACNANDCLFAPLAAFLARALTGAKKLHVDAVIASRTLLMDVAAGDWSDVALSLFELDKSTLPVIVPSDHPVGVIATAHYRIPLQWVGGDQSMVAFSAGVDKANNSAFANIGSGAFVQSPCKKLPDKTRLLKSPLLQADNNTVMALEGTVNAAASALDWLFAKQGELDYQQVAQALEKETAPPVFCNLVAGTGSPWWLPAGEPFFDKEAGPAAKAVAVLESIVFLLQDNLAEIRWQEPGIERLYVSGGLSRYDGFCQKLADISGLPLWRATDPEASARGVAFYLLDIQAAQSGLDIQQFAPADNKALKARYEKHRQIMADCLQAQNR